MSNKPDAPEPTPTQQPITWTGIALSGGGQRATLFTLGVLLHVAGAGKSRDVSSVASVSGGSLTNGYVAQSVDYASVDGVSRSQAMELA